MITDLLRRLERAFARIDDLQRLAAFWGPLTPTASLLSPLVAAGGFVALALLTGLAVSSLSLFLLALVALYVLLTDVFGITVELVPA